MSGRGKGGKGLGKGGAKRHRKILRDNIQGITKPAIRRLARRGGVKRISGLIYEETRGVLKIFLENVIRDSVTYTEHAKRKTVTALDVVYALKRSGRTSPIHLPLHLILHLYPPRLLTTAMSVAVPAPLKSSVKSAASKSSFLGKAVRYLLDTDANPDQCRDPIFLLGVTHPGYDPVDSGEAEAQGQDGSHFWPPEFYADFRSRVWCTYRRDFEPIRDGASRGFTSDAGWGCMLRTGQSLLANALLNIHVGRDWTRPLFPLPSARSPSSFFHYASHHTHAPLSQPAPSPLEDEGSRSRQAAYVRILTWLNDNSNAPFSVHRMALSGKDLGTAVGQWFGPSVAAGAIKTLVQQFPTCGLGVSVATDSVLYETSVFEASHASPSVCDSNSWGDRPVLLLLGLRLGLDGVNPIYHDTIKQLYTFPQSVGISGGRPSSSYYFVGAQGDGLFYLDPHHSRPALPIRSDEDSGEESYTSLELQTYHCEKVRKMPISGLDPSMLLGFLCRSEQDWVDFRTRVDQLPQLIFSIEDEPQSWPSMDLGEDDDEGLALESLASSDDVPALPVTPQAVSLTLDTEIASLARHDSRSLAPDSPVSSSLAHTSSAASSRSTPGKGRLSFSMDDVILFDIDTIHAPASLLGLASLPRMLFCDTLLPSVHVKSISTLSVDVVVYRIFSYPEDLQSDLGEDFNLTASQIRAFLSSAEDVDVEQSTIEELMHILASEQEPGESHTTAAVDVDAFDLEVSDIDMAALYYSPEDDEQTWSQQQIRSMMHHLKERGMSSWVSEYVVKRNTAIPQLLTAFGIHLSPRLLTVSPFAMAFFLRAAMSRELHLRDKLTQYNTIDDALRLISESRKILILTGAGISLSLSQSPVSKDGLYASLKKRGDYDLDDPQQMFDINYFKENPTVFYSFASQIYPSNFVPSPCHRFIKAVEDRNQLLRNYTQNIDTLETLAGVSRVLQCHGSFATASCLLCRRTVPGAEIEADILSQRVPLCIACNVSRNKPKKRGTKKAQGEWDSQDEDESDGPTFPPGIMKPDITFFGEKLTDHFDRSLAADREEVDLLLVIGTSLKVAPVADILSHVPHSVPQILINKTPVRHINPDIILLGNADDIVLHLCAKLAWELPAAVPKQLTTPVYLGDTLRKRSAADLHAAEEPKRVGSSHVWLFEGAEGGDWLERVQQQLSEEASAELVLESNGLSAVEQSSKKPRLV
ncbi:unnamed protein product [Mycena citricolor]|uniref:Histone H4 n=1 Tax=Mycena citricolor TaxID=2018698 RepID=A0AAD2HC97_9AGAR|nr:unnamed protein product [Mycena citricolor]